MSLEEERRLCLMAGRGSVWTHWDWWAVGSVWHFSSAAQPVWAAGSVFYLGIAMWQRGASRGPSSERACLRAARFP